MKIIIEDPFNENKVELSSGGVDIYETMDLVYRTLLAIGFQKETIVKGCEFIIEQYGSNNDQNKD